LKKEADELHTKVTLAQQDAGGNTEELQFKLNLVCGWQAKCNSRSTIVGNFQDCARCTMALCNAPAG
jgi:hypothetical protein